MRRQAREYIPGRVEYFSSRMGLAPTRVSVTSARTRWGSCSGKNTLNFSLYLMSFPPRVIDAVVVHELAHIREKKPFRFLLPAGGGYDARLPAAGRRSQGKAERGAYLGIAGSRKYCQRGERK